MRKTRPAHNPAPVDTLDHPALLDALRLQLDWGADEALLDEPQDRRAPEGAAAAPSELAGEADRKREPPARTTAAARRPEPMRVVADSLEALHAALDAMDTHPLRHTAAHTVAPVGNPAAKLLFLAEAPGPDDDRSGLALSGPPGAQFDRILASAGLNRTRFLFAHLSPWRPPGGRPPSEPELALCLPHLHRLLELAEPTHVVLLGAAPVRALAPGARRGRWATATTGHQALPMQAPHLWLQSPAGKQAAWADLLTLRATLGD